MPLYAYKAMDAKGRLVFGRMDAINPIDLEMRLKRMELDLIDGEPVKPGGFGGARITRRELIAFCFHLDQLARAGVPIIEALADLRDSLDNPRFREVLTDLIESVEGGKTLSQALEAHPKVFDGVFVSLVRAGEETGKLPEVLASLTESLKWQDELAAQTKKLLTYPAFLALVVVLVTLFMMLYLVPQMMAFIRNMGQALPPHTRLLVATSDFFVHYWFVVLGAPLLLAIVLAIAVRTSPQARYRFDGAKLKLPWLGEIVKKIILARFAGVFAMMYASGISVLDSIRTTQGIVGNAVIRAGLERVEQMISEGQNITVAFQNVGLFPPLVIRMLKVGENTGSLDTALNNVSYFYNRDVRESIARVQAMIEPAMTMMVGALLGWVMLSVLGPIYDTITKLKM
ncbi:MAG: type II secretion system F family protein [Rhodocyclaceae bacterium]|nr:type II secretion system F family protein [Rhodocyclaceae bacterium]